MIYVHFSTVPVPCHPFRFCIDKKIVNFHYDIRYFFYIWYKKNSVIFSYFLWKFFCNWFFWWQICWPALLRLHPVAPQLCPPVTVSSCKCFAHIPWINLFCVLKVQKEFLLSPFIGQDQKCRHWAQGVMDVYCIFENKFTIKS